MSNVKSIYSNNFCNYYEELILVISFEFNSCLDN